MKALIARLNHETNTFSPVPTPLEAFAPTYGEQAWQANKGMRTAMAAFIDLAEQWGASLVTPVSAMANPSGPVDAGAYAQLTQRIVDAAPGCDAILLDLHGAMVAEGSDDGEGDLLARLRAAAPGVPLAVALDLHGNITEKMVRNADVMVGFKTYPHVDMYETGEHAGRLLGQMLRGEARFQVCWRQLPLMSHTLRSTTLEGAMRDAVDAARALEAGGLPAATVFAGFSLADIAAPCVSVVATCRAEALESAQAAVDALAQQIWQRRSGYVYRSEPLADSLRRAAGLARGATRPVLLLDHGDNCMSGGTCDTMDVLQAALAQGLSGIAVGPVCDPQAVAQLIAAGEGAQVEIALGNKVALQRIGLHKQPLVLRGTVGAVSDGSYTVTGPIYTGQRCHMGRSVRLDTDAAQIVVTEQTHEPWDLGVFHCVGLDPTQARFVLLKSRMYCRPVFVPLSAGLVECDSPGVTTSDYGRFPFEHVRRPVYPLDAL
ncbi:microcystin degradation protein MlrC [Melaminivora suipulveris]|uniref:Microcystinase C n=1 Tax=Melaminivora suipulveris TaxID=2109913 RepID=A0A2R3QCB8_9BURK|nr:M81 family metallopeptidase [Melaminivora suipulveris]AVO49416.1 microcystin degradation protein MlrC [Melaminivora suipulveris]